MVQGVHTLDERIHLFIVIHLVTIETRWRPNISDNKYNTVTTGDESERRRRRGKEVGYNSSI